MQNATDVNRHRRQPSGNAPASVRSPSFAAPSSSFSSPLAGLLRKVRKPRCAGEWGNPIRIGVQGERAALTSVTGSKRGDGWKNAGNSSLSAA